MPSDTTTNTARVVEVLRRLGSADFDGTGELLAPDFVQEYPFPPTPEVPERIEGAAPFLAFVRAGMGSFDPYAYRVVSLWQTDVADTVICEYTSHTRLVATGTPYSNRYLGIFRFRDDGQLVLWREFINPVTISDLFARAAADGAAAAPRAPLITQSYIEVMNLVYAYPECIDAGDFEGVGRLFEHATVEMGPGNVLVGAAEVQASFERWTRRYPDDGTPHTRHTITNPIVAIDEDAGHGVGALLHPRAAAHRHVPPPTGVGQPLRGPPRAGGRHVALRAPPGLGPHAGRHQPPPDGRARRHGLTGRATVRA